MWSCTSNDNRQTVTVGASFFDLEEQIDSDISKLKELGYGLTKTVKFEENYDELFLEQPDWHAEFETIKQLNINKAQLADKYEVDTIQNGNGTTLVYQSKSPTMAVRRMVVKYEEEKVSEIQVTFGRRNILFSSKNEIIYLPLKSFSIRGNQKALFLSSHDYQVEGSITGKNE